MTINIAMWGKALKVIPRLTKEEWNHLDIISRWLVASRAAVFIMTALAGAIGGLLAYRSGQFHWHLLLLTILGIVLAHATNNLLNDWVDHKKGVDKNNYYRALYGPQPLEHGLLSERSFFGYIIVTGVLALAIGTYLAWVTGPSTWILLGFGLFFLLFYTWPLKYYGLGEPSVIIVWGPLMVGGSYLVTTGGMWSNWVVLISLIYALGPTTVLFGKHTDKLQEDKAKGIRTLPVVIGEKAARYANITFWSLQYVFVIVLMITGVLGPGMILVFLSLPLFFKTLKVYLITRPQHAPAGDPMAAGWPLYLVHYAFVYNRRFGLWFLTGLIIDVILYRNGIV